MLEARLDVDGRQTMVDRKANSMDNEQLTMLEAKVCISQIAQIFADIIFI